MYNILKKELKLFFQSTIAYILLGSYWTISSLLLFVLDTDFNLFNNKFADFNTFFEITPWFIIIIIPALSMRSFVDEFKHGTIEILYSKPISVESILFSKFLSSFLLYIITILPTFYYVVFLNSFTTNESTIDWGNILSGYIGIILLGITFISISLFFSILFKSQISALISSFTICLFQFQLWYEIGLFTSSDILYNLFNLIGIKSHYEKLISGVIYINEIGYFIGLSLIFVGLSIFLLKKNKHL